MREVTLKVYKFDELSNTVQEKVIEKHRDFNLGHEWWDGVYEDFEIICGILGVELKTRSVPLMGGGSRQKPCIWFSGFSSQGDGACFEGRYRCKADAAEKIREYAPQDQGLHEIADKLAADWGGAGPCDSVTIEHHSRYYHANTMLFECSDWEDSEGNMHEPPSSATETAVNCLRDLANWLYRTLEKQHDDLTSDEAVIESIKANELEFYANGSPV